MVRSRSVPYFRLAMTTEALGSDLVTRKSTPSRLASASSILRDTDVSTSLGSAPGYTVRITTTGWLKSGMSS